MTQRNLQTQQQAQAQQQVQQQQMLPQHVLFVRLTEMPVEALQQRVEQECMENPWLEKTASTDPSEGEEWQQQLPSSSGEGPGEGALFDYRSEEDMPDFLSGPSHSNNAAEFVSYDDTLTLTDRLREQMADFDLSDHEKELMEYLIGSLDDDGLLRTPLSDICEQLAIYHDIDLTTAQAEALLRKLQQLDPAGIGARSLQECLLLQIDRRRPSHMKELMQCVVTDHFDEFTKKHWNRIQSALGIGDTLMHNLLSELRHLNPKPGTAMGETMGRSIQQITPDFIVDTADDGTVAFTLNAGDMPRLEVSQSFADLMNEFQNNRDNLSRQQKEALLYTKQKIDAAQSFIDAVETRRRTLNKVMKAILQLQRPFFEEGDEELLRPMILRDVAELTGLDLSTVSRVSNAKYVQTRWGTFPLKYFFSDGYVTQSGEELSTRRIKAALRELINNEDKHKPMSDDLLREALARQGFPIARRTVAKYREQLGFPVARLRKA